MTPSISVVLAVHNGESYLATAIDSILAQTYGDFELVIVDDGSTDATPSVLDSFTDPRIVRIDNRQCVGQTRSLNLALHRARGEFVARLDADDVAMPDRFRQQRALLLDHPDLALVGSAYELIDEHGASLGIAKMPTDCTQLRWALHFISPFAHPATMLRKAALEALGFYDEVYECAQDYDLWSRIAAAYSVANLPECLTQYRVSSTSMTVTRAARMKREESEIRLRNLSRLAPPLLTEVEADRLTALLFRSRRLSADTTSQDVSTLLRLHEAFCRAYGVPASERALHRAAVLAKLGHRLRVAARRSAEEGDPIATWRFLASASRLGNFPVRATAKTAALVLLGLGRRVVSRARGSRCPCPTASQGQGRHSTPP